VLQRVAACCSVLQRVAVCCSVFIHKTLFILLYQISVGLTFLTGKNSRALVQIILQSGKTHGAGRGEEEEEEEEEEEGREGGGGRPKKMSPISTILCTSPVTCVVLLPVAALVEGREVCVRESVCERENERERECVSVCLRVCVCVCV